MPLKEQHRQKLDGIVAQMEANGEPEENVRFVVEDFKQKYGGTQEQVDVKLDYGPGAAAQWTSAIARPVLEGMGAVGGGLLAGGSTLGIGALAGGGAGFAAGRAAANTLDEALGIRKPLPAGQALAEVPGNVLEGSAYEMLGPVVAKGVGGAVQGWRSLKNFLTGANDEGTLAKAGGKLLERSSKGTRYDVNAEEARRVEEATGARFTRGERSNDPKAIAFERSQATRGGEFAVGKKEQQAQVNDALRSYFGREFSQGEVDDFLRFVDQETGKVQQGVRSAQGEVSTEVARLRPKTTALDRGESIQGILRSSKEVERKKAEALYKKIPNVSLDAEHLASTVRNLRDVGSSLIPNYRREHTVSPIITELGEKLGKRAGEQQATPDFGPDLWDVITDEGGILAKSQVKPGEVGSGLYDSFEGIPRHLTSKTGRNLDEMRDSLNSRGFSFDSVDELKDAIRAVGQDRVASRGSGDPLTVDLSSMRELRTEVLAAIRDAEAARDSTLKMKNLQELRNSVETTIDQLNDIDRDDVRQAYRTASAAWADYSQKFDKGAVGAVLAKGPRGEPSRIEPAKVGKVFTSPGGPTAIEQLKKAAGSKVKPLIGEELSESLLTFADDGQGGLVPAKVTLWFNKNKEVLQRYGLREQYSKLEKSAEGLRGAQGKAEAFAKRPIAKVTGVDASRAMDEAFSGKGQRNTAAVAQDILRGVAGDPKATAGAKKAFSDMLWQKMQNAGRDLAENRVMSPAKMTTVLDQYEPALKAFYADEPKKLEAMRTIQRGFQIANRSNVPITAGSDTAEKISSLLSDRLKRKSGEIAVGLVGGGLGGVGGALTGGAVGGGAGAVGGAALFREIYKWAEKKQIQKIDELLLRATFDPDFAQTLLWATKLPGKKVERRVTQHLATLAAASSSPTGD